MNRYQLMIKPWTWSAWHCDEVAFKAGKYLFAVMDGKTRFVLAYGVHGKDSKFSYDPFNLFKAAMDHVGRAPMILVTDGMNRFIKPVQEVFGRCGIDTFVHVREIHLRNQHNHNNKQERLNG